MPVEPVPLDPCYDEAGALLPSCSVSPACKDADGDGFTVGAPSQTRKLVTAGAPSGQSTELVACSLKTDCDDVNEGIFPGAIEVLNDNIDQNCDGVDGVKDTPGTSGGSTTSGVTTGGTTSGGTTAGGDFDADSDGVPDDQDNAPGVPNPDQADSDGDNIADVVDDNQGPDDSDSDGIPDQSDNCPSSADNLDTDGDGTGNGCDNDDDGDGVLDGSDKCPLTPNPQQEDFDGDGIGDNCDVDQGGKDSDGDGIADDFDNCDAVSNIGQEDADSDQIGNACDSENGDSCSDGFDNDGDGLTDAADTEDCGSGTEQACADGQDNDGDGQTDTADCDCTLDADGDNYPEDRTQCDEGSVQLDNCPVAANPLQSDHDGDGYGDDCDICTLGDDHMDADSDGTPDACENQPGQDIDIDGDGIADASDNCPNEANTDQLNTDGDAKGDACDADKDGDGLGEIGIDPKPLVVNKWGYFDKDLTKAGCVDEYNYAIPQIIVYEPGVKRAGLVMVKGTVRAKASLPTRSNCRRYMVQGAGEFTTETANLEYDYGIYIMNGLNSDGIKPAGGDDTSDQDEEDQNGVEEDEGIEMQKLRVDVRNLDYPDSKPSSASWDKVEIRVYFVDGKTLKGCTVAEMEALGGNTESTAIIGGSPLGPSDNGSFTVHLDKYSTAACNSGYNYADVVSANLTDFLKIANVKKIVFKYDSTSLTTNRWGIEALKMTAISSSGEERVFYNNPSVWAWLAVNYTSEQYIKYPTYEGGFCMGSGARGGFGTFPGLAANINGLTYYNIPEFPQGELVFRPSDHAVRITLSTDDSSGSGTLRSLDFKFEGDCGPAGYVRIFGLPEKNKEKTIGFYSANLTASEIKSGFRIKLGDGVSDKLKLDKYKVEVFQAWSLDGHVKKFSNTWDRSEVDGCSGGSDCVTLDAGQSTEKGMVESTINIGDIPYGVMILSD